MPYIRRIPRRIKFQPTVMGSVTLRQAAWAGLGIAMAGLIALGVPFPRLRLEIRLVVAAVPAILFVVVAFGRSRGLPLDVMLVVVIRWYLSARQLVWRHGTFEAFVAGQGGDLEAPAVEVDARAALTFALILVNLMILIILIAIAYYMWRDGIGDMSPAAPA